MHTLLPLAGCAEKKLLSIIIILSILLHKIQQRNYSIGKSVMTNNYFTIEKIDYINDFNMIKRHFSNSTGKGY